MLNQWNGMLCERFALLALLALVLVVPVGAQEPDVLPEDATAPLLAEPIDGLSYNGWAGPGTCDWCNEECYSPKCWGAYPGMGLKCRWHNVFVPRKTAWYWGNAEEFCERPFGTYARAAWNTQVVNGLAAQIVLYRFDFRDPAATSTERAAKLNFRGHERLIKIVEKLKYVAAPLTIEMSGDKELDEMRRQYVIDFLQDDLEFPLPEESVVIGRPTARGLDGEEAFAGYQNLMLQTKSAGAFSPDLKERRTISFGGGLDSDNNDAASLFGR